MAHIEKVISTDKEGFVNGYLVTIDTTGRTGNEEYKFRFPTDGELSEMELNYAISEHASELANSILSDAQELLSRGMLKEANDLINKAKRVTMVCHSVRCNGPYGHKYTAIDEY